MRHGQATGGGVVDFERPLTSRGRKQIDIQAAQFKLPDGIRPDCVMCSTAKRTIQTAEILQKLFKGVPFFYRDTLYLAPVRRLTDLIQNMDDVFSRILIIGHNPGLEQLVGLLDEKGTRLSLGTADCVAIRLNVKSWADIRAGVGEIEKIFLCPI